ncbi:MAG: hypothetical protein IIC31_11910, partial [Chloroflexi bacterium]|nr:hypothetical protein [Chloroflexota bacterium]
MRLVAIQQKTPRAPKAPKAKVSFLCQDCGHSSPKWDGRCPACGAWGTYVEFTEPGRAARSLRPAGVALPAGMALPAEP